MSGTRLTELVAELLQEVEKLEKENQELKLRLTRPVNLSGPAAPLHDSGVDGVLREALVDAFSHLNNRKWMMAASVVADHFGVNFMIKQDPSFFALRRMMYSHLSMPPAPARWDKSPEANIIRERRKNIRSMVYTYIDRMGDYYMRQIEAHRARSGG